VENCKVRVIKYDIRSVFNSSCILYHILGAVSREMTLLAALEACLILGTTTVAQAIDKSGPRSSKTIPSHVIGATATVALHRRQSRCVQSTSRRGSARVATANTSGAAGADTSDVAEATTIIALLTTTLNSQVRAFGLDMTYAPTRVALLRSDSSRRGARRGLMTRLATVVAEALLRRAVLSYMPQIPALEASLP